MKTKPLNLSAPDLTQHPPRSPRVRLGGYVLLWALKPAEEGIEKGIIARLWNLSSEPRKFALSLATGISGAQRATHIETDIEVAAVSGGALSGSAAASQMLTFRLFPGGASKLKAPAATNIRRATRRN
ncbi:MAG: glycosyl hydrolase-related protein [Blastocatellia bacterium]